jgi:hypothetical protein
MVVKIKRKTKKARGRPATGVDPLVNFRLPVARISDLDEWAKEEGLTRSAALRHLVERGLKGVRS